MWATFSESDTTPFGSYVDYILDDKVRREDEGGREGGIGRRGRASFGALAQR